MPDRETDGKPRGKAPLLSALIVLALVIYFASTWPCQWALDRGLLPDSTRPAIQSFYWPIGWIGRHVHWLRGLNTWWDDLELSPFRTHGGVI